MTSPEEDAIAEVLQNAIHVAEKFEEWLSQTCVEGNCVWCGTPTCVCAFCMEVTLGIHTCCKCFRRLFMDLDRMEPGGLDAHD